MPNPFGVPEISAVDLAAKRANSDDFVLLDVREPHELTLANLGDGVETAPLSLLVQMGPESLPLSVQDNKDAEVVVMCHHGSRSAQVVAWLRQNGWTNVINLDGGIHAYAIEVDPAVGSY